MLKLSSGGATKANWVGLPADHFNHFNPFRAMTPVMGCCLMPQPSTAPTPFRCAGAFASSLTDHNKLRLSIVGG